MATIKWLAVAVVAFCAVSVYCLPAEERLQESDVELNQRAEKAATFGPIRSWLRNRWPTTKAKLASLISSMKKKTRSEVAAENVAEVSGVLSEISRSEKGLRPYPTGPRKWHKPAKTAEVVNSRPIFEDTDDVQLQPSKRLGLVGTVLVKSGLKFAFKKIAGKLRGKRDLADFEEADSVQASAEDEAIVEIIEDAIESEELEESLQEAIPENLEELLTETVARAEKYELPILDVEDNWLSTKHDAVVVTLTSGQRLLVVKGYEFFRDKSTDVLDAEVMSDNWNLIDWKDTSEGSTLADYVSANEASYNSSHAAQKLMALD